MNKRLIYTTTWINITIIMLNEINQTKRKELALLFHLYKTPENGDN